MRGALAVALALAPLALGACVTSTQATRLQTDLDEVKRQIFQVQQETAGSRGRLDEIDRKLGSRTSSSLAGQADLQATMQTLLDRLQALTSEIEEIRSRMAELSRQMQSSGARPGTPLSTAPGGLSPAPPRAAGGAGEQAFKTAYADYSKGNYELAAMGFRDFLRDNPEHPLAADAEYWIGECLFSQGKFSEAAEAFDGALANHPGSSKTAAALLKKGYAQMEAGQTSLAVATLQQLIESAPDADEARLAAERLRQLGLRVR